MSGIRTVIDWLTDGARSGTASEDVLEELCRRMIGAGIPLWRAAVFVNTLHPDVIGRAFIWQVDTGVKISSAKYDILETEEYRTSPVVAVYGTRKPLRRHLADGDCPDDFPIVHELRAEGATDYAAIPML
ncbi:MAG: adenylate/guanylate cyclase domain-containing protein, partial [Hyphomicrobiales bacterium]